MVFVRAICRGNRAVHSTERIGCFMAEPELAIISEIVKRGYVRFIVAALKLPVIDNDDSMYLCCNHLRMSRR
jgi:hypothetical protein